MPNFNNTVNINQCRQLLWRLLRKSPDSHENYIHCLGRILNYLGHEDISFFECPGDVFVYLHLELWSEIWSQVETHPNARCELMDLQLSTCDRITLDRWRTPRLISLFFLSLRCSWRGPLFLLWRTSSATQFVSTSLAHHSYSVFLHIKCQAHWPLCVSCWSESSLATTSLTGERVAATEPSLSDWTGVGGGGHPSGQEQKREAQEGKTPHPVQPRPSPAPTGRAAEPPVKHPFGQSVFRCDRGRTKETERLEPDSIYHNLSARRSTQWGVATHRSQGPFSGYKQTFFSC